ncbi:hypothetical protein GCK72_016353 [Caenorhabditis remanei]|uniref:C-type lectin domain-containing protein n=1 Tax=Caenorhabditis remanei TaxID=31234 RepID=A0A6A5GZD9_CAERE|nr:hypothetical protein GCK72_016353 [Caenorhabditis remanei]KAF1759886.1 hypothetical protein GCK72_016353 [Caenorhabditis remanei]
MIFHLILVYFLISFVQAQNKCITNDDDRYIDGACFTFFNIPLNFTAAQEYCQHHAPSAWSILAKETSDTQAIWLAKIAVTEFEMNSGYFWIGVYRETTYDNFKTMDGFYLRYQRFAVMNPSMNYVAARTSDGKWYTLPEERRLPFVCSYYPTNVVQTAANAPRVLKSLKELFYL